ncbi:hypothetical protein R7O11_26985, partial [Vibrio sp. Vb2362]|nr:hypothetical protein [Vibrio sp. Vb2362]
DLDLSDIKQDASHFYQSEYQRFKENQSYWQSLLHESIQHMEVDESELSYWHSITADYLEGRLFPILS